MSAQSLDARRTEGRHKANVLYLTNRYPLFDSLEEALEFRMLTNARVPEHAPFFVIGLWWIVEAGEREAFNVPRRALDMPTY
jgi:hypothetical protein